jgi:hypothetical protein
MIQFRVLVVDLQHPARQTTAGYTAKFYQLIFKFKENLHLSAITA